MFIFIELCKDRRQAVDLYSVSTSRSDEMAQLKLTGGRHTTPTLNSLRWLSSVPGGALYFEEVNTSGDVVEPLSACVLHGLLGNGRNVRSFVNNLLKSAGEASWRALLPDLRNHGKSAQQFPKTPPHTIPAAAVDVMQLWAAQLRHRQVPELLVGHSMGGKISLEILRQLKEQPGSSTPKHVRGGKQALSCRAVLCAMSRKSQSSHTIKLGVAGLLHCHPPFYFLHA